MSKIIVLTHNPKGKWGDVRPQIEQGSYENWGKGGMNFELGQQVFIYISKGVNQIKYIMEVYNIYDDSVDLRLVRKLDELESELLSFEKLKQNGLKVGTVNYVLNNNESLYKYVMNVLNNNLGKEIMKKNTIETKNIILYGTPGVGKTHNYQKLITMIEKANSEKEIFDSITSNEKIDLNSDDFQKIKDDKRVEFVTFHQSYSYEDFIEGFRPQEGGNIELQDGIFKELSKKAQENLDNSKKNITQITQKIKFESIFEDFKDFIQGDIDTKEKFIINDTAYIVNIEEDAFRYTGDKWGNTQRMKFKDIELLNELDIQDRKEIKKVQEISGLAKQHATYFSYFMKQFFEFKQSKEANIQVSNVSKKEQKNFYIVIDEINRGNISKIFGELITLIEESKRDNYEVTLPYSKEKFKVPSNLYIIATMNSTDKSIATIDIALRRRFTFLKMKPNSNLVTNIKAQEFMRKANQYISRELSEDYQLGHSYFMGDDIDLEFIKDYKIKPLLEEYFYVEDKDVETILTEIEKENLKDEQ